MNEPSTISEQSPKGGGNFAQPRSFWGIFPSLFLCATIAFIAWLLVSKRAGPMRRLWVPIVFQTNGVPLVLGETRQVEFWTPSAKTRDYLHVTGGLVAEKEKWQMLSNDDPVVEFGSVLRSNRNVYGYRRVEEWGQGTTSYKPGWWWTINVTTNFSVADLAHTYQLFWKSPQAVLVEVIDNRGSTEK